MKLQGRVYGYGDTVYFTLADVLEGCLEDGILAVRSDKGETPVIYDSIREVRSERYVVHAAELERLGLRNG